MKKRGGRLTRGQVATENLILYTAVILLIAVGLIAVWQSGALRPQVHRRGYIGFSQIVPTDWVVSVEDKVALSLKSEADAPVIVPAGSINAQVNRVQCPPGPSADVAIQPGEKVIIIMNCPGIGAEHDLGEEFEMDVTTAYRNTVSGRTHESAGKIYGFIENLGDFTPTTSTTTTTTLKPECMNVECDEPGEMDLDNCSIIQYGQPPRRRLCDYCPENLGLFPDGKRKCWPNGKCGDVCDVDWDCIDPTNPLNLCDICVDRTCQESGTEQCGPCAPAGARTIDPLVCPVVGCEYCYDHYDVNSAATLYECEDKGDCLEPCTIPGNGYTECELLCTYCSPDTSSPTGLSCEQGDCGRRCGFPGDDECELGCQWCNMTTFECEMGDCGKPCTTGDECELGCDVCDSGICVHGIGVLITAYNDTEPNVLGKVVDIDQTIFLTVEGQITPPLAIGRILVSNGTWLWDSSLDTKPGLVTVEGDCNAFVEHAAWGPQQRFDSRIAAEGNTYNPLDDIWYRDNINLTWREYYTSCPNTGDPLTNCRNVWTTSEEEVGRYCYFAIAQRQTALGDGEWSRIGTDHIDVGYINVTLVYPINGSGGT